MNERNVGGGRGALLRMLMEDSQSHSSESTGNPIRNVGLGIQDSGIGFSQSPTLSANRPMGRSHLLAMLSDSSSGASTTQSQNEFPAGRGRARLLSILASEMESKAALSSVPSDEAVYKSEASGTSAGVRQSKSTGPQGRGRMLSNLMQTHLNVDSETQPQEEEEREYDINEKEPVIKRGTRGTPVNIACNYIRLRSDKNKGVFEYEVKFSPNVDSKSARIKYLNEHRNKFGGTRTFDGVTLYLPILMQDKITYYTSKNPADDTDIEIKIIYKRQKPLRECIHLYNVLFDRIMKILHYVRFDRKQYDPTAPKIIPQHKLEIWPGYVTAVDEYEDGIMLCCDTSHRVLCQTTVLDALFDAYQASPKDFQVNAKKALLGQIVLTRYNNNTYRIDDIDFDTNPQSTFETKDRKITFLEYYEKQYNITIRDLKQPLLKSIKKRRVANSDIPMELHFLLIPEICYLTGLRDSMRTDTIVMRDIATFTRITPNQRMLALTKFYTNIINSKEAREVLENWGLTLDSDVERLVGRQLENEMVVFLNKEFSAGTNADFGKYATNNELLDVVNVIDWLLIYSKNDSNAAKSFLDCYERNSHPMGIQVSKPNIHIMNNDRTDSYVSTLREKITKKTQVVVIICPTARDDRYAAIKKICCTEIPVPSQVINARTLKDPAKNRSIVQKIALQINCKLGGSLWSIKIPFKKVMICGIDSYHEAGNRGNSVAAFVASLNENYTNWYSRAIIQTNKEEIVNGLCVSLKHALVAYDKRNNCLPDKIIIYRDGVGDGELRVVKEYEVPQLEQACRMENKDYKPLITYIVVQKRINTRLFMETGRNDFKNPNPGFVMDHTITRKYMYDFFLVSQAVRQGTVTPSHYIVIYDSSQINPDIVQRLSYRLCFLYYNWPGTVRVPACCQYAHKLAYLVGQSIKRPTSEILATKLFYL